MITRFQNRIIGDQHWLIHCILFSSKQLFRVQDLGIKRIKQSNNESTKCYS